MSRGRGAIAGYLGAGALLLAIAAGLAWIALRGSSEEPDARLKAALEPTFKEQSIRAPFEARKQRGIFSDKLIIEFAPQEFQKSSHGRKDVLVIPLVAAGYAATQLDSRVDQIEIRTVNGDENLVRMNMEIDSINEFIAGKIDAPRLLEEARFEVIEWKPAATDSTQLAKEYLERGRLFTNRKGDPKRALPYFEKAYQLDPENFDVLFALGITQLTLGDVPGAVHKLEAAVKAGPNNYRVYPPLARAYLAQRRGEDAVAALQNFFNLWKSAPQSDPFFVPALYQAAAAAYDAGELAAAEAVLTGKLLRLAPDHAEGWLLLGKTQMARKRKGEALASFRKSAELKPQGWPTWQELGWYFNELKDYSSAVLAYRRSYTLGSRDVNLFLGLSHAYNQLGRFFDAKNVIVEGFRHHLNDPDLERNFRAVQWTIAKRRLRSSSTPAPIALPEG